MSTNSNIPTQKKVVSVEILHLDELGYGPQGKHTRREWRAECLENLLGGKDLFEAWQDSWVNLIEPKLIYKSFGCVLSYEDRSTETVLESAWSGQPTYSFDFIGHIFIDDLNVRKFNINQKILFDEARFVGHAEFANVNFHNDVNFNGAKFEITAEFRNATFGGRLSCSNVHFKQYANFHSAKFLGSVFFEKTMFDNAAHFSGARFAKNVEFIGAKFLRTDFVGAIFENSSNFKKTIFISDANFENARFENVGHFEEAKFLLVSPAFRGCLMDSTRLEFSDDSYFPSKEYSEDGVKNISFLKRLSDEHGQIEQSLNFNAMELHARRLLTHPSANISFRVPTWLYEKISDYGRSFAKPIFWYGVLICLSALLAMIYSTYSDSPAAEQQVLCKPIKDQPPPLKLPYGRAVVEYAMFRAGGLMDFTDTGKQNNSVNCRLFEEPIEPPLMRAWGIFKGIASIALLFLAALGLRNKYRIK